MPVTCFTEVARLHTASILAAGLSPKTSDWYAQQFSHFDRWRIEKQLDDVIPSTAIFEEYLGFQRAKGLRPATVNAHYRALAAIINFAIQRNMHPRTENPMELMRPPRIPRERPPHVTPRDMKALLAACYTADWLDHRDQLILCLLFYSGLRLGEVCGLAVSDLDLSRMEVFVRRGKGAKPRTVPMAQEVRQPLLDYLYTRPSVSEHLLLSSTAQGESRGAFTGEGVRMMLRRRCQQAGIDSLSAHKFRHGFALWLRNNGADLSDIAAAMGHTTTQVTQLYYAYTLPPAVHKAYNAAIAKLRESNE
jgi:integrase